MPIIDGIGSGVCTARKLDDLAAILSYQMGVAQRVLAKHYSWLDPRYHYVDATAGKGICPEYGKGSPLIFVETAQKLGITYCADLIERDMGNFTALQANVPTAVKCHLGEYESKLPELLHKNWLGLVFFDPSGNAVTLDTVIRISRQAPRMDILMYLAAANFKRQLYLGRMRIADYIERSHKRCWLIREPDGKHQWTFLFGSNTDLWQGLRSHDFYRLDSEEGQTILDRVNHTKEELQRQLQPELVPYASYEEYLLHPRFRAIREQVITKAAGVCEQCRQHEVTEVHHLRYPPWGTFDVPENLIAVCHQCHCQIHGKEK